MLLLQQEVRDEQHKPNRFGIPFPAASCGDDGENPRLTPARSARKNQTLERSSSGTEGSSGKKFELATPPADSTTRALRGFCFILKSVQNFLSLYFS